MKNKQTSNWKPVHSKNQVFFKAFNHSHWHASSNEDRLIQYLSVLSQDFESDILPTDPIEKNIKAMALAEASTAAAKQFKCTNAVELKNNCQWFYENYWQYLDYADEELREEPQAIVYDWGDEPALCSII